jgi:hypothetical protein
MKFSFNHIKYELDNGDANYESRTTTTECRP